MKTKKILFILIMMASAVLSHAELINIQIDGLTYHCNTITKEAIVGKTIERDNIETAIIPDAIEVDGVSYSVTSITSSAFSRCTNLKSVTIGGAVRSIKNNVFSNCTSLTSISIPANVEEIGSSSFSGCSLEYADFQSFESLCSIVFANCDANPLSCSQKLYVGGKEMADLSLPDGITKIGNYAFYGCPGITSLIFPESLCEIGEEAFSACSGITSLSLPNSLRKIGLKAFQKCTGISKLDLPEGVTSIGEKAFYGCSSLREISMPSTIRTIGQDCFNKDFYSANQMSIEKVDFASVESLCAIRFGNEYSNPLWYTKKLLVNGKEITDLVIPEGVTDIGDYVFEYCSGLKSIHFPESIKEIGESFIECTGLERVEYASVESLCGIFFRGEYYSNPLRYAHNLYIDSKEVTDLFIPEGVESVGACAFQWSNITSVTLSDDVKRVGGDAFACCPKLKSVRFGKGIEQVASAFYECPEFDHVEFADLNCLWRMYFNVQYPISYNNPLYFGHHLYSNGKEVKEVTFPEGMKEIKQGVLLGCESVERIHVPEGVEAIRELAFRDCKNLVSIDLPSTLQLLYFSEFTGDGPFDSCESLEEIRVREGNPYLDSREDCNAAIFTETNTLVVGSNNTVIPKSVTGITRRAFYGRTKLTSIFIPSSVVWLGHESFSECSSLKDFYYDAKNLPDLKNGDPFSDTPIENATLHVPENMIEAFRTTAPWSGFGNIVALLPEEIPNNYKEGDYAYRPFVEDGKRWVLGFYEDGADPTETQPTKIMNQYIEGDTIIDGQQWKQLWWSMEDESGHTVRGLDGYLYEKDQKVYIIYPLGPIIGFLHYDFSTPTGEQINFSSNSDSTNTAAICTIGKKTICESDTYKGVCTEILPPEGQDFSATWMQGVGYLGFFNISFADKSRCRLMSCTVGDEVLYYDTSLIPQNLEVKKKRLDFTHVIKAQPKAPQQGTGQEGTETLKGEYSDSEMFVRLNNLAGTYSITLTDEAGKEVYAKEVLTDNVLALSTDLLTYAPGTYTLTVENEYEKFVTILNLTTDIASTPAPTQNKGALYDLSGRRLERAPQKGIYIQNGVKVLVK